ncbi:hypothetical protein CYMTET_37778 [Cymbomonas tetramitiformis]|uniref:Uncharacterized protein n=1 Tax=Cymbomonas tetramitiformis TaxID=36881 RepID=A0AAE0F5W6_9CHLO|nr:hypothetical protein CYMTET_37780 [Cymbomonas tetramitiformis]KAK3252953.1 hypothetical protein CYMTET_37778 [Cymbomonas tetramitiformis]
MHLSASLSAFHKGFLRQVRLRPVKSPICAPESPQKSCQAARNAALSRKTVNRSSRRSFSLELSFLSGIFGFCKRADWAMAFEDPGEALSDLRSEYQMALSSFEAAAADANVAEKMDFALVVDLVYPSLVKAEQGDPTGRVRAAKTKLRCLVRETLCPTMSCSNGLLSSLRCAAYTGQQATPERKQELASQAVMVLKKGQKGIDALFAIDRFPY